MNNLNLECLESRDVPATVTQAVGDFMVNHTVQQFQYEYWNLLGLRPNAYLDDDNKPLLEAFGVDNRGHDAISKVYVMRHTTRAELQAIREEIADYFLADQSLGEAQRMFLSWNYRSTPNYGTVYTNGNSTVVGWNQAQTFQAGTNWTAYTFPLLGCTAVIAYTEEGTGHFSHFDRNGVNPVQMRLLNTFMQSNPSATVMVIGINAMPVARAIATLPNAPHRILTHVKTGYLETSYSIRASWHDGQMSVDIDSRPISTNYLPSALVSLNPVVFNYPAGHTWEALPDQDSDYLTATFQTFI